MHFEWEAGNLHRLGNWEVLVVNRPVYRLEELSSFQSLCGTRNGNGTTRNLKKINFCHEFVSTLVVEMKVV